MPASIAAIPSATMPVPTSPAVRPASITLAVASGQNERDLSLGLNPNHRRVWTNEARRGSVSSQRQNQRHNSSQNCGLVFMSCNGMNYLILEQELRETSSQKSRNVACYFSRPCG